MEDKSFVNLINDDVLNRIKIDPRLREPFKNVMKRMQKYFNANGYTSQRDYKDFFEKYLIGKDFEICVIDDLSNKSVYSSYEKDKHRICIDKRLLSNQQLECALCHEFIHFLVMHDKNVSDGFVNETLTEMLTREMYRYSCRYEPQVKLMNFACVSRNQNIDFSKFLQGYLKESFDYNRNNNFWDYFCNYAELYHKQFAGSMYKMEDAENDKNYILAQQTVFSHILCYNFGEYVQVLEKLRYAPVNDDEHINKFLEKIEKQVIENLFNKEMMKFASLKFKEYHLIREELRDSSPIKLGDKERKLKSILKGLSLDKRVLLEIPDKEKLIKLERFQLPALESKKNKLIYVYVAVYPDGIKVLNNVIKVKEAHDIELRGSYGLHDNVDGTVYAYDSSYLTLPDANRNLNKVMISKIIGDYRKSSKYDEKQEEMIFEYALEYYFDENLKFLNPERRKEIIEDIIKLLDKFFVTINGDRIDVSLMDRDKSAFLGTREVLLDKEGNGLYNDYMDEALMDLKDKYYSIILEMKQLYDCRAKLTYDEYFPKMEKLITELDKIKLQLKSRHFDFIEEEYGDQDFHEKVNDIRRTMQTKQKLENNQNEEQNQNEEKSLESMSLKERYYFIDGKMRSLYDHREKLDDTEYSSAMKKLIVKRDELKIKLDNNHIELDKKKDSDEDRKYYEELCLFRSIMENERLLRQERDRQQAEIDRLRAEGNHRGIRNL